MLLYQFIGDKMSKILLFSDIHIHMHKNQFSRLEDCLRALEWVFETALARKIKTIVFGGDLFQDRNKIHVISYEKTFKLINKYCGDGDLNLCVLVGNHDMWYSDKWDVSSVGPLTAIKNVQVINQPCSLTLEDCTIDFLPYTRNPIEDINNHFQSKNDILISHCSVDGAKLNTFFNTKAEISVEYEGDMVKVDTNAFKGWKRVFLGHYHAAQKLNDVVEYIGSPLELNFGEAFQEKHIIVFDTETLDTEYVLNDFSPKHLIIKEDDIENYDIGGNFVQIMVNDVTSTNIIDMKKSIKDKGCCTVEFREKTQKKEELTDEDKKEIKNKLDFSSGDILEKWIKAKGHGKLEFDKLLAIGQDVVRRAQ
jgi:DNA repair exonuclease SbcCD nuclease subunit